METVRLYREGDIVFAQVSDWQALYVNGELKAEGHSLSPRIVLHALGFKFETITFDDEILDDFSGYMPITLKKLKEAIEEAE